MELVLTCPTCVTDDIEAFLSKIMDDDPLPDNFMDEEYYLFGGKGMVEQLTPAFRSFILIKNKSKLFLIKNISKRWWHCNVAMNALRIRCR